jgi:hypothetical protein
MNTFYKSVRRGRDRMVMGLTNTCVITNVVRLLILENAY